MHATDYMKVDRVSKGHIQFSCNTTDLEDVLYQLENFGKRTVRVTSLQSSHNSCGLSIYTEKL